MFNIGQDTSFKFIYLPTEIIKIAVTKGKTIAVELG